ncbi:unnamed protein product [Rotaria magnacalcarata]|uniref:Pentapeptide repeat-containing protein n=2 Tax=Rotaria magnacalcarata TaxID=392030 RepID=A0A8S2R7I0_9BILA|nr:unnamed protein product [Rotaria magnacalcarata]
MQALDKATNTKHIRYANVHHHCSRLTIKTFFHLLGQLLLPLLLTIFTVIITFDQRKENRIQRFEDRRLAEQQRQQDLNISRQQRVEDRELANDQREQDLNISREQRDMDKWIAEQQRQHDRQLAVEKREADDLNAAIQRNMTRDQRMYEINIEQERYKKENEKYLDALLLSYYNEMGELMLKTNEKPLSSNPIIFSLVRAKTLNVIEQIGPIRTVYLLMFLYGAGQLSIGESSLDLTEARLDNIDLRNQRNLVKIFLNGAHLHGASFIGQNISYGNFTNAYLYRANFSGSTCIGTIFNGAYLVEADFSYSNIRNASFIEVNMRRATFYKTIGKNTHFQFTQMQETNFSDAVFDCILINTRGFFDSNLAASDFRRARLSQCQFVYCNMTQIDFSATDLRIANLTASIISYGSFDNADLGGAILWATNLSYANLSTVQCSGSVGNISFCLFKQALTLENAQMQNQLIGSPPANLLYDEGRPHCALSVLGDTSSIANDSRWKISPANSIFNQYRLLNDKKLNACIFTPINQTNQVEMNHYVDLNIYKTLIQARRAKATVLCHVGYSTRVIITQYDENNKSLDSSESIQYRWSELLKLSTTSLKLSVQFYRPIGRDQSWCHYVHLHVEVDFKTPDTQLLHPWEI